MTEAPANIDAVTAAHVLSNDDLEYEDMSARTLPRSAAFC